MKVLILAAGYGSRLALFLKDLPKPLFPLNSQGDSCLSLMLENLKRSNLNDILIVGGYKIEKIKSFLKLPSEDPQLSVELIDASRSFHKGPLYSFLASNYALDAQQHFALFPGDTVFHPKFYDFFAKIDFKMLRSNAIHLFYCRSENFESWGNIGLQLNYLATGPSVSGFSTFSSHSDLNYSGNQLENVLLPILILPGAIYETIQSNISPSDTTVFHILMKICEKSLMEIIPHRIPDISYPFKDLDKEEDIFLIRDLIK